MLNPALIAFTVLRIVYIVFIMDHGQIASLVWNPLNLQFPIMNLTPDDRTLRSASSALRRCDSDAAASKTASQNLYILRQAVRTAPAADRPNRPSRSSYLARERESESERRFPPQWWAQLTSGASGPALDSQRNFPPKKPALCYNMVALTHDGLEIMLPVHDPSLLTLLLFRVSPLFI